MATLDELSVKIGAQTADFTAGAETVESQLGDLSSEALQTAASMEILSNRSDDAGDNISQTGRRATVASGQLTALGGSASAANTSFMGLSATTWGSLIPAVIALGAALAPVIGALGGFVAVAGSIAAVGLIPAIGAIATNTEMLKDGVNDLISTIRSEFAPVFDLAAGSLLYLMEQFEEIIPALVPTESVIGRIARNFELLGEALIDSLPAFTELAVTLTDEFLPPFVDWVENILPDIPGMVDDLVTVFDRMIPKFQRAGSVLIDFLGPFTEFGFTVLNVLGPALTWLTRSMTDVLQVVNDARFAFGRLVASGSLLAPIIAGLASVLGGPVTLALAAVVGGVIALRRAWVSNFGRIRDFYTGVFAQIQKTLPALRAAFNSFVSGLDVQRLVADGRELARVYGNQLMQVLKALGPVFSDLRVFLRENQEEFRVLGSAIGSVASAGLRLATVMTKTVGPAFTEVIIPALRLTIRLLDYIMGFARAPAQALSGNIQGIGNILRGENDLNEELVLQPGAGPNPRGLQGLQLQDQEVRVVLEEDTENLRATVQSEAEGVVTEQKRRATRNTGGTTGL